MTKVDRQNVGEVATALRQGLDDWRRDKMGSEVEFWDQAAGIYKCLFEEDYSDFNPNRFTRTAGQGDDRYSR